MYSQFTNNNEKTLYRPSRVIHGLGRPTD